MSYCTQGHRATGGLCIPTARSGFTKTRLHPVAPHPLQPAWRPLRLAWEVESPRGGISHRTSHRTSQIPPHIESPSERPNLPEAMGGDAMPLTRVCGRRPYVRTPGPACVGDVWARRAGGLTSSRRRSATCRPHQHMGCQTWRGRRSTPAPARRAASRRRARRRQGRRRRARARSTPCERSGAAAPCR
jgi:hypothetical protein